MSRNTILAMLIGAGLGGLLVGLHAHGRSRAGAEPAPDTRPADEARPDEVRGPHPPHPRWPFEGVARPTEEQEAELMEFLKDHHPEGYRKLLLLRKHRAERYEVALGLTWKLYREAKDAPPEVRKALVRLWKTRAEIHKTLRKWRAAAPADRPRLEDDLHDLLADQFDDEQTVQKHKLRVLADRLEKLKTGWHDRQDSREKIVKQRLESLLDAARHGRRPGDRRPFRGPRDRRGRRHHDRHEPHHDRPMSEEDSSD